MILYKYMTSEGLQGCLEHGTLRFTRPATFNDPFDCLGSVTSPSVIISDEDFFKSNHTKLMMLRYSMGVLSLTRNPLNLLMWAHYAKNHTGAVIGIDTELAGLEDPDENTITCTNGSVVYTSLRPNLDNEDIYFPSNIPSKPDTSLLEKIFLHKSIHWFYEEEVRAVRTMTNDNINDHQDFKFQLNSIKEIYLGARFYHNYKKPKASTPELDALIEMDCEVFDCRLDPIKWEITAQPYHAA